MATGGQAGCKTHLRKVGFEPLEALGMIKSDHKWTAAVTPKSRLKDIVVRRLAPEDDQHFTQMLDLFAEAFDDPESYSSARPTATYRQALLARPDVFVMVALAENSVVGALVAYELKKFEQERSEVYIYDLAVAQNWRRQGVATAIIEHLKALAKAAGGWVIYVQADYGDAPAIALYTKLGTREDVMHFDLLLED